MKKSVRHLAADILNRVGQNRLFAGDLLDICLDANALSRTPDGRLLTHLVYGVLRHRDHLDWITAKLYRGDFRKLDEAIKNILRLGIYQLKFSERLPDFAVVNEAVKTAKIVQPDKSAMVNAVLRNYLRRGQEIPVPSFEKNPAQYVATFYSHPLWLVKKWSKLFGMEDTVSLCSADNELPPVTLRVNTLKISREELMQKFVEAGFAPEETRHAPDGIILNTSFNPVQKTDLFKSGFLRLQDEGAQLISYLVNASSNDAILDACAGSGGKTAHLAAILKNKGQIVAVDCNEDKIAALQQETKRLGINIIEAQCLDLESGLPVAFRNKFDYVLVDAPCSGTGTLRRNPEIKWRVSEKDLRRFSATQKIILQNSSAAVKKGGCVIYCTCSLLSEENEKVVDDFLKHHADFFLCAPPPSINSCFIDSRGFFRTYPHRHDAMDGLFGAILRRQ